MKTYCISHVKDVDGLGAAALVFAATGAEVVLTDYDSLISELGRVPDDAEHLVVCDMGSDNSNLGEFLSLMKDHTKKGKVTYVDHHYMSPATKRKLAAASVRLVHDDRECSSMLAYAEFRKSLPGGASLVALYGAVTDYTDTSPMATKMMEQADRQFVLLESTLLAYALSKKGENEDFPMKLVDWLAEMKHPHEMPGVPEYAMEQLADIVKLEKEVKEHGKKMGRLAYMVTSQHSTGNVSKLLIGAFDVPVGVALKEKRKGWYEVSLRGTSECRIHLGQTIDRVSRKLGGNGGGHRRAAGCSIPVEKAADMLSALAKKV